MKYNVPLLASNPERCLHATVMVYKQGNRLPFELKESDNITIPKFILQNQSEMNSLFHLKTMDTYLYIQHKFFFANVYSLSNNLQVRHMPCMK